MPVTFEPSESRATKNVHILDITLKSRVMNTGRYVTKTKLKLIKSWQFTPKYITICNKQSTQYFNKSKFTQKVKQKKFKYNIIF